MTWHRPALLLLATILLQVCLAEDLYWEGDEEAADEFLQVRDDDSSLRRAKRGWFDWIPALSTTTTTPPPENYEAVTEDSDDTALDDVTGSKDDEDHVEGSGAIGERTEPDVGDQTIRVTFVVMEPFRVDYSDRDSPEFQKFAQSMVNSVNALFEKLPGTQRANFVRIQSRPSDEFSCKVTMDISTVGFNNTERIIAELRDHIHNVRRLGDVPVNDQNFDAKIVNPGSTFELCAFDQLECEDGTCVSTMARCNSTRECPDGSDELACPRDDLFDEQSNNQWQGGFPVPAEPRARISCSVPALCSSSSVTYCPQQKCDGHNDCPLGDDETNCFEAGKESLSFTPEANVPPPSTTQSPLYEPQPTTCAKGEFRCDENRCLPLAAVCDNTLDCHDGADEASCKSESDDISSDDCDEDEDDVQGETDEESTSQSDED